MVCDYIEKGLSDLLCAYCMKRQTANIEMLNEYVRKDIHDHVSFDLSFWIPLTKVFKIRFSKSEKVVLDTQALSYSLKPSLLDDGS